MFLEICKGRGRRKYELKYAKRTVWLGRSMSIDGDNYTSQYFVISSKCFGSHATTTISAV